MLLKLNGNTNLTSNNQIKCQVIDCILMWMCFLIYSQDVQGHAGIPR